MRAIQGAFPRMRDGLLFEINGERRVHMTLLCLLCNFGLEHVGLNQIRSVHVAGLSRDANDVMDSV